MLKQVAVGSVLALGISSAEAAVITYSASAPVDDVVISHNPTPGTPNGTNTWNTRWVNGDSAKNEAVGQSFTVGTSGFELGAITIWQKAMNAQLDDNQFYLNIFELTNTSTAPTSLGDRVHSEVIAAGQFSSAQVDQFVTIALASPVTLDANTVYAFVVGTHTTNGDEGALAFYNTRNRADYADGLAITIENNNGTTSGIDLLPSNSTAAWTFQAGDNANRDLVFYVHQIPEPAALSLVGLGGLMLLGRPRRSSQV